MSVTRGSLWQCDNSECGVETFRTDYRMPDGWVWRVTTEGIIHFCPKCAENLLNLKPKNRK